MGRNWTYDKLIEGLADQELFTTSLVVKKGQQDGFFDQVRDLAWAMKIAGSSLAHFVKALPEEPEGYIKPDHRRTLFPAWFGRTWKEALALRKEQTKRPTKASSPKNKKENRHARAGKTSGRPRNSIYSRILEDLERDEVYTPATIARFARSQGYLDLRVDPRRAYRRARIAFGRMSQIHSFPKEGDGLVLMKGQKGVMGWFGWRWQAILAGKTSLVSG